MKFIVIGTTEFTGRIAEGIRGGGHDICAVFSMPSKYRPDNSDDLKQVSQTYGCAYHEVIDINGEESVALLKTYKPDYIFSSWPKILKKDVLQTPKHCCIGTHPTQLPFNRGRHPLHWLLDLGISKTCLSFFKMIEEIDGGDIFLQVPLSIKSEDTIADLTRRVNDAAFSGAKTIGDQLTSSNSLSAIQQNDVMANYWRKRTQHDVTLDLRMSSEAIIRIVRSYAPPFPCANLLFKSHVLKIHEAIISSEKIALDECERIEPGKIVKIEDTLIRVKTFDEILDLRSYSSIPAELCKAKYIHPPSKYILDYHEDFQARLA
ncbi:MAG: formyltransferase family protein [Nitrospirales bacterium]